MPTAVLPATPTSPSPAQRLEALRHVQAQAEQRIKLGAQLLKAAEAHAAETQSYAESLRHEQNSLRKQLEREIAQVFANYDDKLHGLDDRLTQRLDTLEEKLNALARVWMQAEEKVERMVHRAEALLDQSRVLMERNRSMNPTVPRAVAAVMLAAHEQAKLGGGSVA